MPTYKELSVLQESLAKAEESCARRYKIGDDKHYVVRLDPHFRHSMRLRRRASGVIRASHDALAPFHATVNQTVEKPCPDDPGAYYPIELATMTPREVMQCAEYRAVVDSWVRGEISELPPSTAFLVSRPERDGGFVE
jgi:hypothetical protein